MQFSVLNLLLFATILQGIFLFVALKRAGLGNFFLTALLLLAVWLQLEFLAVRNVTLFRIPFLYSSRYGIWLLAGPLLFFYVQSFFNKGFVFKIKEGLHFLPAFIFVVLIPILLKDLIPYRGIHYGMLSVLKYPQEDETGFEAFYGLVFVLQFVHFLLYIFLAWRVVKQYEKKASTGQMQWLRRIILAALGILLCTLGFYLLIIYCEFQSIREMDYLYVIPFTCFVYWINYQLIKTPMVFRDDLKMVKVGKKYEKSSLTQEKASQYLQALDNYMRSAKPYLEEELKLGLVAATLNIPEHHLSQVLNEQLSQTFYDYIMQFRVEEAQQLMMTKGDKSILEIAYAVGFNNKTSFNKHFKRVSGLTPTEFLKKKSTNE